MISGWIWPRSFYYCLTFNYTIFKNIFISSVMILAIQQNCEVEIWWDKNASSTMIQHTHVDIRIYIIMESALLSQWSLSRGVQQCRFMTILKILYTDELSILNYTILLSVYITSLNQVFFCVTVCVCVSFVLQLLQIMNRSLWYFLRG